MANWAYRFSLASDCIAGMAKILQTLEAKEHALKAGELAKLLGVTQQHIYKMAAASAIPSFRTGAAVRFDPKQVAQWLTRRMPQTVEIQSAFIDIRRNSQISSILGFGSGVLYVRIPAFEVRSFSKPVSA